METMSSTMKNLSNEYGMHTWGKGRKRVMGPLSMARSKHQFQYNKRRSFPTEVEIGLWPTDYSPFDHVWFTVVVFTSEDATPSIRSMEARKFWWQRCNSLPV